MWRSRFLKVALVVGTLIATPTLTHAPAHAWDIKKMNQAIDQTNFLVNNGCSGTLIDLEQGYILTANHCVATQYEIVEIDDIKEDGEVKKKKIRRLRDGEVRQLKFEGADSTVVTSYKVRVKAVDSQRDLALLQVIAKLPNTQAAKLACTEPVRGEKVYVVGNPMGVLYSSVVTGVVSSLQRTYGMVGAQEDDRQRNEALMQVSGGVVGGNSGGATYNDRGELIGVPVLGSRINEVIAFAVPLPVVRAFLKEQKVAMASACDPVGSGGVTP